MQLTDKQKFESAVQHAIDAAIKHYPDEITDVLMCALRRVLQNRNGGLALEENEAAGWGTALEESLMDGEIDETYVSASQHA